MSGICIHGMEMPNNCISCAARHGAECWLANCSYMPNFRKERPEWCPLVPVQPHGRLIDAEALIERIPIASYEIYENIRSFLESAPTVIPAEEDE